MTMQRSLSVVYQVLLFLLLANAQQAVARAISDYYLDVSFDIPHSKIIGLAELTVSVETELILKTEGLTIKRVQLNKQRIDYHTENGIVRVAPHENGLLEIEYEAVFKADAAPDDIYYGFSGNVIDKRGISLTGLWYPRIDALSIYRLKATLPLDYVAISEAEKIDRVERNGKLEFRFEFEHPLDGINLIATDRYEVTEDRFNDIELHAYFFPEDKALARTYLEYAKHYLELYRKLLLPFPFKRFAIVENFLPTGYSMPTYTLLGQDVVRLPFIAETSLGHEILHQWFGNLVYTGEGEGNWAEGLTTYLADHLYAEQKNEGWRYRKQISIDYGSYVDDAHDFTLRRFTHRVDLASRSIGYGKSAMVFHMLKQAVGDEVFFDALRRFTRQGQFQRAAWEDVRSAFEQQSGKELGWFFEQWLDQKGLPELHMSHVSLERKESGLVLSFNLSQGQSTYKLTVPITVSYKSGDKNKTSVELNKSEKNVRLELEQEPDKIIIDENYDIPRKLTEPETPAVIGSLLGSDKMIVVRPIGDEAAYQPVIDGFRRRGAAVRPAESLKDTEIQSSTLLLLGKDSPTIRRLYGRVEIPQTGFNVIIKKNPWNLGRIVGIVSTDSAAEARLGFPKVLHYGKYSMLRFKEGVNVSKTIEPSERGIQRALPGEPPAIDLSTLKSLSDVIEKVASKRIVYVGEAHDKFSHHMVQLRILQGLYRKDPKIAVGMEMFQRPFQKAIDEYIAGTIDERTFLKRSEYFKRWSIDYNLYKPILDFAKSRGIPVVALNLRSEIIEKVSNDGVDFLSEDEKQEIPRELDFSDLGYRERLEEVFKKHPNSEAKQFEFFYQAQVLWDETMAESIDAFLKMNPYFRMVVMAGSGHLSYGSGIPKRAFRRNGYEYSIILNDFEIERGIADHIVFPETLTAITAPMLMVYLKDEDQKVSIAGFAEDSVSEQAGLKVGDILVSLDGDPVNNIEDVKISLFFKKIGETIKIGVRRSGLLSGAEELEFEVKL